MSLQNFHQSLQRLSADSDNDLLHYFAVTTALRTLADLSSSKVLAVGLKGVGKSAAFRYLTEIDTSPDLIIGISPSSSHQPTPGLNKNKLEIYSYQAQLPTVRVNWAICKEQFEHDLVIETLRVISTKKAFFKSKINAKHLSAATKRFNSYKKLLLGALGRFRGASILGCGFTIGGPTGGSLAGLRSTREAQESLTLLKAICDSGFAIRVVIDDPELVLSASQELDIHLLGGLFLAAVTLSRQVSNFKMIVLIKTHIYDAVSNPDFEKFPDREVYLSWCIDELLDVISSRMHWAKVSWEEVFAGTESQAKELIAKRIANNIRNGPRDLLRWLDLAMQRSGTRKITAHNIAETERDFSLYALSALKNAFAMSYPVVEVALRCIFKNVKNTKFSREALEKRIAELLVTDPTLMKLAASDSTGEFNSLDLPKLLFKIGGLALGSGSRLILPYEKDYDSEHFDLAEYVQLVPALAPAV